MAPQRFYGFHTFAEKGYPIDVNGAFRDNVRVFLEHCAEPQDYDAKGKQVWCTLLVNENKGNLVPLYTIEEDVESSERPLCDYCRGAGWRHHFVSRRKYHFIIPRNDGWDKPPDEDAFDLQTHLLHGLIHCNGFGHLCCINGIEGGSKMVRGEEIMDLWDRICTSLRARKISVEDLSKKHMMDLRLLYGVTYGLSWFGKWGYRFCRGSFGAKDHNYDSAIETLASFELDRAITDIRLVNGSNGLSQTIDYYRNLSEDNLLTIRDLFKFLLSLKSKSQFGNSCSLLSFPISSGCTPGLNFSSNSKGRCLRTSTKCGLKSVSFGKGRVLRCRKFSNVAAHMESRWPMKRLNYVADVIVEALKEKRQKTDSNSCGMTRQEARDAARLYIGDTGLIDHVLKAMNDVSIGNYIVHRAANRKTKLLEYTLQDLEDDHLDEVGSVEAAEPKQMRKLVARPGSNMYDDIAGLYDNLLLGCQCSDSVKWAVQTILNGKIFAKEWMFRDENDHSLRFVCTLRTSSITLDSDYELPWKHATTREYVSVPLYATVGDLKLAIRDTVRDTYCIMKHLEVTEIVNLEEVDEDEVLFGNIESGVEVSFRAIGIDSASDLRYEGGSDSWTVKCKCGAKDDDGERMVSCDVCDNWQHTRCNGIQDSEQVPRLYVCDDCCVPFAPVRSMHCGLGFDDVESYDRSMMMMMTTPNYMCPLEDFA